MSNNIPSVLSSLTLNEYTVFTKEQMRDYLMTRLQSLSNWSEIESVLNGTGTLDLILDLVSSAGEINSFFNLRSQQESFLEFAQIDENIFARARELGYRINRYSAPAIIVRYNDEPTIELRRGDVFGSYGKYDLVYFEKESKKIEKGDMIPLIIGKYGAQSKSFDRSETEDVSIILEPQYLNSIDNNHVILIYDSVEQEKTFFPEDYIVYNQWCDYSQSQTTTAVRAANFNLSYGLFEIFEKGVANLFTVEYIETDGPLTETFSISNLNLDKRFLFYQLGSNGYNCDSIKSIVENAPLMYSLMRRAVTENDYKFLLTHLPQFRDASITTYQGKLGIYEIKIGEVKKDVNYWVRINELTYSYQNTSDTMSSDDIIEILYEQLKTNELVKVSKEGEIGKQYLKLISISPKILLVINAVKTYINCTVLQTQQPPTQCTLHVHYVSENTVDDPVPLTSYEYGQQVGPIVNEYKMVGLTLLYEHCVKAPVKLKYIITLEDASDKELVQKLIDETISEFDLRTDLVIDTTQIGNTIAKKANFKWGRQIISNLVDSYKTITMIDKTQYCKLSSEIIYVS